MSKKSVLSDTESETIPYLDLQEMLVLLHLAGYPDDNEGIVRHPGTGDRHDDTAAMKAIDFLFNIRRTVGGIEIEDQEFDATRIDGIQRRMIEDLNRFQKRGNEPEPIESLLDLEHIVGLTGDSEKSARDIVLDGLAVICANPLRQGFTVRISEKTRILSCDVFETYVDHFMNDTIRNAKADFYTFDMHRRHGFATIKERHDAFGPILTLRETDFDEHFRLIEFVAAMHKKRYLKIIGIPPFGTRDPAFRVRIMRKLLDEETSYRSGRSATKDIRIFDIPKGTPWEDIELRFKNGRDIDIYVSGKYFEKINAEELGCSNRKTGRPDTQWALLQRFSTSQGIIGFSGLDNKKRDQLKQYKAILSKRFQEAIGIEGDPIVYDTMKKEYKTRFRILPEPDLRGDGEIRRSGVGLLRDKEPYSSDNPLKHEYDFKN